MIIFSLAVIQQCEGISVIELMPPLRLYEIILPKKLAWQSAWQSVDLSFSSSTPPYSKITVNTAMHTICIYSEAISTVPCVNCPLDNMWAFYTSNVYPKAEIFNCESASKFPQHEVYNLLVKIINSLKYAS